MGFLFLKIQIFPDIMNLRLCANIDLNSINIGENMKALLIIEGLNISSEEMQSFNRRNIQGFEQISLNSFMFDLCESSSLLADLQVYLQNRGTHYSLFYFEKPPVHFKHPK